jgi:hypothetical protein
MDFQLLIFDQPTLIKSRILFSSPVYGTKADYRSYLGGVEKDGEGKVIKAQAMRSLWIVRVNLTAITEEDRAIIAAASFVVSVLILLAYRCDDESVCSFAGYKRARILEQMKEGSPVVLIERFYGNLMGER